MNRIIRIFAALAAVISMLCLSACQLLAPASGTGTVKLRDGGSLRYEVAGSGPAVVLIHGFTLDRRMWRTQVEALSPHYTVITYDARGFGDSSVPGGPYSPRADLAELLDHLRVDKAHMVGLSAGARVATDFALEYPQRTLSVVAADAGLNGMPASQEWAKELGEVFGAAKTEGIKGAKIRWAETSIFAPAARDAATKAEIGRMLTSYSGWHFVNADPMTQLAPPTASRLREIAVPVLVIYGERDIGYVKLVSLRMASEIPDARMVVVPDAGHMSNMERPATFNRALAEFLRAHS